MDEIKPSTFTVHGTMKCRLCGAWHPFEPVVLQENKAVPEIFYRCGDALHQAQDDDVIGPPADN